LNRLIDFVRRFRTERERLAVVVHRADTHLAEIGARSGRDMETDRLIIPGQYATEYAQHMAERDRAQQQIQRMQIAVDSATERLKLRLTKPRLYGVAEFPHLRLLSAVPRAYVEQEPLVSDEAVQQLVTRLEELVRAPLRDPTAPPRQPETAAGG
jgi:hypothetical protein